MLAAIGFRVWGFANGDVGGIEGYKGISWLWDLGGFGFMQSVWRPSKPEDAKGALT